MIGDLTDMSTPITRGELRDEMAQFEARLERKLDVKFSANDDKFAAIDDKFAAIDDKFAAIDGKFTAIDGKFTAIDDRFDALDDKVDKLGHRLDDKIDNLGRRLDDKIDNLGHRLDDKIDNLERKIDDKIDRLDRKVENNFGLWAEALQAQFRRDMAIQFKESEKRLFSEIARLTKSTLESMATQFSALDDKYKDLPARVTKLEADVGALK